MPPEDDGEPEPTTAETPEDAAAAAAVARKELGIVVGSSDGGEDAHVDGEAPPCPPPVRSFHHPSLPPAIPALVGALPDIVVPTPVQCQALPVAVSGSDLIAIANAGSGKTLAYMLPAVNSLFGRVVAAPSSAVPSGAGGAGSGAAAAPAVVQSIGAREYRAAIIPTLPSEPRVLVLVPTRELALQVLAVAHALRKFGVRSAAVIGGVKKDTQQEKLKSGVHLLIATPGRLGDLLAAKGVSLGRVQLVVSHPAGCRVAGLLAHVFAIAGVG